MYFPEVDYISGIISRHPEGVLITGMFVMLGIVYTGCRFGRAYVDAKDRRELKERNHVRRLDRDIT